ncbi:MAG: hypothetical protein V2A34_02570 [Lentisphaerota bacterium]
MTATGHMTIQRTTAPNGDTAVEIIMVAPRHIIENIETAVLIEAHKKGIQHVQQIDGISNDRG